MNQAKMNSQQPNATNDYLNSMISNSKDFSQIRKKPTAGQIVANMHKRS